MVQDNNLCKVVFAEIQSLSNAYAKARGNLDSKIALLIGEAGILIGLFLNLNQNKNGLLIIPIIFFILAIIICLIGYLPMSIQYFPSPDMICYIMYGIKNGSISNEKRLFEIMASFDNIQNIKKALKNCEQTIQRKFYALIIGIALTFAGIMAEIIIIYCL